MWPILYILKWLITLLDIPGGDSHASVQPHRRLPPQTRLLPDEHQHLYEEQQLRLWDLGCEWLSLLTHTHMHTHVLTHCITWNLIPVSSPIRAKQWRTFSDRTSACTSSRYRPSDRETTCFSDVHKGNRIDWRTEIWIVIIKTCRKTCWWADGEP